MFPREVDEVLHMKFYVDKFLDRAFVYYPSCPYANRKGYVQRARCIVWLTGRHIPKGFVVHHLNKNKYNDGPFNLKVMSNGQHTTHHMTGRPASEYCKMRMSETMRGKKWALGLKWTEERKAKLSESKRRQWAEPNGPYAIRRVK